MSLPRFIVAALLSLAVTAMVNAGSSPSLVPGYLRELPPESPVARQLRHQRVAERRVGPALLAHRGACTLAPENTLEAYAAAMDFGADGCEVDVRRTADGVLVMFHDDMLDHLTDGIGAVEELSYSELLALHPRHLFGPATARTRPPTFVATLELARQRAMLLHLDVKQPGLEEEIARLLDAADAWDHVVALNTETLPRLLRHSKIKLLRYKGAAYENRFDFAPTAIRQLLAKPGELLILEDPRLAAHELKRLPYSPSSTRLSTLESDWPFTRPESSALTKSPAPSDFMPASYLRTLEPQASSIDQLLELLRDDDLEQRRRPADHPVAEAQRTRRILERAWAAERLGQLSVRSPRLIARLESQVQHPSWHRDWRFQGLDASLAARALARLRSVDSVPLLIDAFNRVEPDLSRVRNPAWTNTPLAWVDWRRGYFVGAVAALNCDVARRFLQDYVRKSDAQAREISVPQFEEATAGLLRYRLGRAELKSLLTSSNDAVRGTAILTCLDHPSPQRTDALREHAPWAVKLPKAAP